MIDAMANSEIDRAGQLLNESHASLRDDFQVSTPGIDELAAQLQATSGVYGARLVGGGFGGCLIVLHRDDIDLTATYRNAWRLRPGAGALR